MSFSGDFFVLFFADNESGGGDVVNLLYAGQCGHLRARLLALLCQQLSTLGGNLHLAFAEFGG